MLECQCTQAGAFRSKHITVADLSAASAAAFFFMQNAQSHVCSIFSWCLIMCSNSPRSSILMYARMVRKSMRVLGCSMFLHARERR
jgi:hypothetical protein